MIITEKGEVYVVDPESYSLDARLKMGSAREKFGKIIDHIDRIIQKRGKS